MDLGALETQIETLITAASFNAHVISSQDAEYLYVIKWLPPRFLVSIAGSNPTAFQAVSFQQVSPLFFLR
jgi:hypothetical protein